MKELIRKILKNKIPVISNKPPSVWIEDVKFHENDFAIGDRKWKTPTLINAAKEQNCEVFDLPLAGIDLSSTPFEISNIDDFIFQAKRVEKVDLSNPIILDWCGYVADGWHRIVKAILKGDRTIKAIRLKKYVQPSYEENK